MSESEMSVRRIHIVVIFTQMRSILIVQHTHTVRTNKHQTE